MICRRRFLLAFMLATAPGLSAAVAVGHDEGGNAASSLALGFENDDQRPLDRFLEHWHKNVHSVTDEVLAKKPEVEREAYAVFRAFYTPSVSDLEKKYVIVQNDLAVLLIDDDLSGIFGTMGQFEGGKGGLSTPGDRLSKIAVINQFTLHDFRPPLSIEGLEVLYLSPCYLHALLGFLVGNAMQVEASQNMPLVDRYWSVAHGCELSDESPESGKRHSELVARKERLHYLNTHLNIIPEHWGTGWYFATHPLAEKLYLNRNRTRAAIEFREGYNGGEVYLEKNERGIWKIVHRDHSWVE